MVLFILALIISFVPCVALFLWLRNLHKQDGTDFRKLCNKTFGFGMLSVLPIIILSLASNLILNISGLYDISPLLYEAIYTFVVLALVEELTKFAVFRLILKKTTGYQFSWLDVTALMTVVGLGFDVIESIAYGIGASIPVVLVRGICIPHAGYGFITGYFYGKGLKSGKASDRWTGFFLAFFIHGLYDFSLSPEFVALNENLFFVAMLLALLDILLVIMLVVFCRKAKKNEMYTAPLIAQSQK